MTNIERIEQLHAIRMKRRCRVLRQPGDRVIVRGQTGAIDAVFADLQAAVACGLVDSDWYESQNERPRTEPGDAWYSVVLPTGAVLVGDDDLIGAGWVSGDG